MMQNLRGAEVGRDLVHAPLLKPGPTRAGPCPIEFWIFKDEDSIASLFDHPHRKHFFSYV